MPPLPLLADVTNTDFPALTGVARATVLPILLSALDETANRPEDSPRLTAMLAEELAREEYADGPAASLTAVYLARLVLEHEFDHVRAAALRLVQDLDLPGAAAVSPMAATVVADMTQNAYAAVRRADADDDVSAALGLIFALEGATARLFKQLRRLESRSRNGEVLSAVTAIREYQDTP